MVQVDIYRSKLAQYDIIVIDTGIYLSGTAFDFITQYMNTHIDESVKSLWFWDDSNKCIQPCLKYQGIAIKLTGHLHDLTAAKSMIQTVVQDAIDTISL